MIDVGEIRSEIAEIIATINIKRSVIIFTSLFCNRVDNARHRIAVFGIKGTANNLEFLYAAVVDVEPAAVVVRIGNGNTVHLIRDFGRSSTAYMEPSSSVFRNAGLKS